MASILTDPSNPVMPILIIGIIAVVYIGAIGLAVAWAITARRGDDIAREAHPAGEPLIPPGTCLVCGNLNCVRHAAIVRNTTR